MSATPVVTAPPGPWPATVLRGVRSLFTANEAATAGTTARWLLLLLLLVGAAVRFWGLGDIGLHREDEDTSALPVLHILEDGTPRFPSGMFYARAIVQSYLMAGSVWLFGNSEWALRLPSALCGVLLIFLCWLAGRRFLRPAWNLAFAAVIALLPSLVLASQTARMYIFLLACLAGYAALVFRWERSGRVKDLAWAVAMMWLGMQFHPLAVFGAFLLFFPPMLQADARRFWQAMAAFAVSVAGYFVVIEWVGLYYPPRAENYSAEPVLSGPVAGPLVPPLPLWLPLIAALAAACQAWLVSRRIPKRGAAYAVGALVFAGLAVQAVPAYHVAALLLLAASIVALRHNRNALPMLLLVALASAALAVFHLLRLQAAGIDSLKLIGGVMLSWPSVWPYVRIGDYSLPALLVCGAGLVAALWQLGLGRRLPDFWLMFVLWGWLPLLMVGWFSWYPPPRYTIVTVLPLLLTAMAALQWAMQSLSVWRTSLATGAVAAAGALLVVNPLALADTMGAGYRIHPDHVGAAHYVRSQSPGPRDIVLAEDVIVQYYYLERVDYWLLARASAADFVERIDGEVRDIYTGTRIMGSGEELQALIDEPDRGTIYIVGSGENQEDGRRHMRGEGIHRLLTSGALPVGYMGRDGLTRVWKIPPKER